MAAKLKWVNVALRAIMEGGIVMAFAYWGYQTGSSLLGRILLAIGAPLLVFGFWCIVDFRQAGRMAEPLRLVQEVSADLGQRQITLVDAEGHVGNFIARQLSGATWVDHATAERLILAGQTWGLTAQHVDGLIREQIATNRRHNASLERWNRLAYSLAGVVLVLGVTCLGVWILMHDKRAAPPPDSVADQEPVPASASRTSKPKWWDYELAVAIARARVEITNFGSVYDHLRSGDASQRGAGCQPGGNRTNFLERRYPRWIAHHDRLQL